MGYKHSLRYVDLPGFDPGFDSSLVDFQYEPYPESIAGDPPPVLIIAAVQLKAGGFWGKSSLAPDFPYPASAQTTLIFASGGHDESIVVPVTRVEELSEIPEEKMIHASVHALIGLISSENPAVQETVETVLSSEHTYRLMPVAGLFASVGVLAEFRARQIGIEPPAREVRHRAQVSSDVVDADGVPF